MSLPLVGMTQHHDWDEATIRRNYSPHPRMEWPDGTFYHRYAGIAQLDPDITTPTLNALLGLDEDRWLVVGITANPHSGSRLVQGKPRHDHVRVYAVDKERRSETHSQPGGFHLDEEDIEVVEFLLHDIPLEELWKAFKTVRLSAVLKGIDPARIKVAGLADIPIQPEHP